MHGEQDVKTRPGDPYAWWGVAKASLRLGNAETAAEQFDRAVNLGVPAIYYLYRQEAFEAWTQVGWYSRMLQVTGPALTSFPKSKELLKFHNVAREALGD
ncbi:hypothetical protein GCM10010840_30630 [Deinococcus aerolatus]|uniref:Tetratricopeptide repeat-containing protein n=1 Tax=Deinococcus aerolatus TaxID=522487 RepID=A0ABQ2GEC3_9DEIO|nr:hypothetical protein [Deinococcus aerolatus]GGL90458.1 hypothetical protein GCM10010840_30630 [Deinococcus aerolatus]